MWFTAQQRGRSALSGRILLVGLLSVAVLAILLSRQTMADVTAVFQADGSEAITIEYRDDDHVRLRSPDGSFIVLTGGSGYIVSREDGQWQVFALDDFRDMMSRMGMAQGGGAAAPVAPDVEDGTLRDTGRTEMIAGIQGRVHEVVMTDGWDEEVVGEIVLSDDADAQAAFRGMLRITGLMGDLAGQQGMGDMFDKLYGIEEQAVLRADDGWQLVSIERGSIHDNAFSLPAEPMAIPGFGGGGRAAAQSRGQRGGAASGAASGAATGGANVDSSEAAQQSWLAREAEDLGAAATDEAGAVTEEVVDETRSGVTDDIRDGVRRGMRGLFDR